MGADNMIDVTRGAYDATYKAAAFAWNNHAEDAVRWQAAAALVVGALIGALVVIVAKPVISNVTYLSSRVACQLRCCLDVHVAPEKLPMVRTTNKVGQRKTGMRSQQTRATPKQWNAMRMKLGTSVPDESIVDLVANYGDDVEGAARVYYGPGYTGR